VSPVTVLLLDEKSKTNYLLVADFCIVDGNECVDMTLLTYSSIFRGSSESCDACYALFVVSLFPVHPYPFPWPFP